MFFLKILLGFSQFLQLQYWELGLAGYRTRGHWNLLWLQLNVTNNFLELIFGWNTTSSKTTFVIAVVILQALAISPPMWKPIVKLVYHPLGYSSSIRWFHSSETLYSPLKGQYTSLVTWITRWTIFIWVRFCWIFSNFSKSMRVTWHHFRNQLWEKKL